MEAIIFSIEEIQEIEAKLSRFADQLARLPLYTRSARSKAHLFTLTQKARAITHVGVLSDEKRQQVIMELDAAADRLIEEYDLKEQIDQTESVFGKSADLIGHLFARAFDFGLPATWEHDMEAIVASYKPLFLSIARSVLGDYDAAQDAVQDALEKAWKHLPTFSLDRYLELRLKTWICRIVYRTAINQRRRESWLLPIDEVDWVLQRPGRIFDRPDVCALRNETVNVIKEALLELPRRQRELILYRFIKEYQLADIANVLHCPLGTVKGQLHRALQSLQESLMKKGLQAKDITTWTEHDTTTLQSHITLDDGSESTW